VKWGWLLLSQWRGETVWGAVVEETCALAIGGGACGNDNGVCR